MVRRFRIWTDAERREALSGVDFGAPGFALALVGGVGGAVSSCLLAAADGLEEEILEGDTEGAALSVEHVRALWRLGASCPEFDAEQVSAEYLSEEERESSELVETMTAALSFVWVDASRRWIVLPEGVSESEAVGRFLSAFRRGEVPVVSSAPWWTPAERARRWSCPVCVDDDGRAPALLPVASGWRCPVCGCVSASPEDDGAGVLPALE